MGARLKRHQRFTDDASDSVSAAVTEVAVATGCAVEVVNIESAAISHFDVV